MTPMHISPRLPLSFPELAASSRFPNHGSPEHFVSAYAHRNPSGKVREDEGDERKIQISKREGIRSVLASQLTLHYE